MGAPPAPGLRAEGIGEALDPHYRGKVRGPGARQTLGGEHADRALGMAAAVEIGLSMLV